MATDETEEETKAETQPSLSFNDINQTISINFPETDSTSTDLQESRSSININKWPSATNVGNSDNIISPTQHPTRYEDIKIQTKDTNRDLAIDFFRITYDSQMDVEQEQSYMTDTRFEVNRKLATMEDFEKLLIESRPMIHVSTHGQHQYKSVDETNEFQIAFEQTQTLRSLIDDDEEFSAYYAVIALLFEMEINEFVQYGVKHKYHNKNPLKTWIWKGHTQFYLLDNGKIYAMLLTILQRFGCDYEENKEAFCIIIYWGHYYMENNVLCNIPPHPPMMAYQFQTLLSGDEDVRDELVKIEKKYNLTLDQNERIAKSLRKFQLFSWEILCVILQDMLFLQDAFPQHTDDTKWDDKQTKDQRSKPNVLNNDNNNNNNNGNNDDEFETSSFFDDDFNRTTSIKYGKIQDLSREIKIIPKIDRGEYEKYTNKERNEFIVNIAKYKNRLIQLLKKKPEVEIIFDADSPKSSNVHIVRFGNKNALNLAKKIISEQQLRPKIQDLYDIEFNEISKSDDNTKHQVGYIKSTEPKIYSIDIKNKTDPISVALQKHLKSKEECKIKLLVINGCHSFVLGKIFSEYVENVICIHPYVQIWDSTATTFTKYFYQSLQENTNPSKSLRQSVFEAYTFAKLMVAKECPNDRMCQSHSHIHINHNEFNEIHLNENWDKLQETINDTEKFKDYRLKMERSRHNKPKMDLYDDKTLIISNVSKKEMEKLRLYLEDLKPEIEIKRNDNNDKNKDNDNDTNTDNDDNNNNTMLSPLGDIGNIPRQRSSFVKQYSHSPDAHYEELSVAFFKFKTPSHRKEAGKILTQKQHEEACKLSKQLLLDDKKDNNNNDGDKDKDDMNMAWIHRNVPKCCCAPHHPHLSQDKLILLQNGQIINRSMIDNLEEIQNTLQKMKEREKKLEKLINSKQSQSALLLANIDEIDDDDDDEENDENHDIEKEQNDEMDNNKNDNNDNNKNKNNKKKKIRYVNFTKKMNDFGTDNIKYYQFKNEFGVKSKPKMNKGNNF